MHDHALPLLDVFSHLSFIVLAGKTIAIGKVLKLLD